MKNLYSALLTVLLFSCGSSETAEQAGDKIELEAQPKQLISRYIPENILALNKKEDLEQLRVTMKDNLFGRFFCDRAEFYIISAPSNKLFETGIESITLCFLDGKLRQTRYVMERDVATHLIKTLGNFEIIPHDLKNRDIVASQLVIMKDREGEFINSDLDNYEVRWTLEDRQVIYRVNASSHERFSYTERSINYEREFRSVENHCI